MIAARLDPAVRLVAFNTSSNLRSPEAVARHQNGSIASDQLSIQVWIF